MNIAEEKINEKKTNELENEQTSYRLEKNICFLYTYLTKDMCLEYIKHSKSVIRSYFYKTLEPTSKRYTSIQ